MGRGGECSQSAIYVVVNKKLMIDLSNQIKAPYAIISTDVSNYFDRVLYPFAGIRY